MTIFYDGVCALCSRLVRFVVARDRADRFRFAPLQGEYARQLLERHGKNPDDVDTVYLLTDDGHLFAKARAILEIFRQLGGVWRLLSGLRILPWPLLDLGYDAVARTRYRIFGRHDTCALPDPSQRHKFIE